MKTIKIRHCTPGMMVSPTYDQMHLKRNTAYMILEDIKYVLKLGSYELIRYYGHEIVEIISV